MSERRFALLVSLPGLLLVALVVLPPILLTFYMSLHRIELTKTDTWSFVFLRNFLVRLPLDTDVVAAIPRTIGFALLTTVITVPLALITALVLNRRFRFGPALFVITLMPWAVAPVVTGLFWRFMFQSRGLATGIMMLLHLTNQPINWLDNTNTAIGIAIFATAWRSVPLLTVLILAALKTIPRDLYRAAKMDSATAWERFRFITLPGIRNTLLIVGILQVIISLQVFDVLFTLTGGGPGRDTYVMVYAIYQNAFTGLSFGYASALTVVLFGMILICSAVLVYLRVSSRGSRQGTDELNPLATAGLAQTPHLAAFRGPGAAVLESPPVTVAPRFPSATRRRLIRPPRWVPGVGVGVTIAALIVFYAGPIAWIIISSTQPENALTVAPPALTTNLDLSGVGTLLSNPLWQQSLLVSLQVAIFGTALTLIIASLAAYPLARYRIRGKGVLMAVLIFTQMVPAIVMAIPVMIVFQDINLKDTVLSLVIVNVAFSLPLIVWLLRNVFEDVPLALEKAARIDGCSRLGTLFRITLPTASPGISAAAILLLIGMWNEFLFAVVLGDRNAITLTRRISFQESYHSVASATINLAPPMHLLAAAGLIAVAPCLILVMLFHRRILSGLTEGFVKG